MERKVVLICQATGHPGNEATVPPHSSWGPGGCGAPGGGGAGDPASLPGPLWQTLRPPGPHSGQERFSPPASLLASCRLWAPVSPHTSFFPPLDLWPWPYGHKPENRGLCGPFQPSTPMCPCSVPEEACWKRNSTIKSLGNRGP